MKIKGRSKGSLIYLPAELALSVLCNLYHEDAIDLLSGTLVEYDEEKGYMYVAGGKYKGWIAPYVGNRYFAPLSALELLAGEAE